MFLGGDDVLIVTLGGGVGVYDIRTGAPRWKIEIPVGVASQPLVLGSSVIVAGMDGFVRKIRMDSGVVEWTSRVSAESLGGVAASQGFVFVTTGDDALWALDEKTGKSSWTYKRPSPQGSVYWSLRGNSIPVLSPDGRKLYLGFSDGVFVALESSSGQTVWERNFDRAGRFRDADSPAQLSKDGSLLFLPLVDGDLLALKTGDGTTLWSVPGGGGAPPLVDEEEGAAYVSLVSGGIQKISLKDTKLAWTVDLGDRGSASTPVGVLGGNVAFTTTRSGLMFLDRQTGAIVAEKRLGTGIIAPQAFDGRRLAVISPRNDLLLYRIEARGSDAEGPRS
jgi:outer membrane protein assembly factor BamB